MKTCIEYRSTVCVCECVCGTGEEGLGGRGGGGSSLGVEARRTATRGMNPAGGGDNSWARPSPVFRRVPASDHLPASPARAAQHSGPDPVSASAPARSDETASKQKRARHESDESLALDDGLHQKREVQ